MNSELLKEMNKSKDTLAVIIDTIKTSKSMEIGDLIDLVEFMHQIYEPMYETGESEWQSFACKHALKHCLPLTKLLLTKEQVTSDDDMLQKAYLLYRKTFAFVGRRSLEHFIEFMEWERTSHNQIYSNRKEVLYPFVYYLNKMTFNDSGKYLIASYPPSYGKTFVTNYYSAWLYGINLNTSILRMSYSDDLVVGSARSIKELVSSPLFAEVFPDYKRFGGKCFEKEKESEWKIKGADVLTSHYARTRDGAVTGVRANRAIIFDDMTKGKEESTNATLHTALYDKWKSEWVNRRSGSHVKYIFVGTMWSPEDILNRVRMDLERKSPLVPSKLFEYCWETEDGHGVVIAVPLLDVNDKSTCENVITTEEALDLRDTTDEYLFSCVYQQSPIAPSGLVFANDNLLKYNIDDVKFDNYAMAVLDPARRGKDNVSMPIFQIDVKNDRSDHCLVDVLYQMKPMTDLYDDIVQKIIDNNVIDFVIENNIDTSLAFVIETKLKEKGYLNCTIREKYATKNKEERIKNARGVILKRCRFKPRTAYSKNSDYGRFMQDLERYSFDFPNKHDDSPDSLALYVNEIVLDKYRLPKAKAFDRSRLGI